MMKIVYVSTYHSNFWKMPVSKFLTMCSEGIHRGSVDINKYGTFMKRRPKGFYQGESKSGHMRSFFFSKFGNTMYFDITDWRKEDFQDAFEEIARWK